MIKLQREEVRILKNQKLAAIEDSGKAGETVRLLNEWEAERGSGVKWTISPANPPLKRTRRDKAARL